jgi:hypothetical protein
VSGFEDLAGELSTVDESGVSRMAKLARDQLLLEQRLVQLEEETKEVTRALKQVQEEEIPNLMSELGVQSFKLVDGSEIKVQKYYAASIPKERQAEAFDWLNRNGFGDLIKNQVATNFVRGQEQHAEAFAQECVDRGLAVNTKKWVEPMTLKAFAKEQIETGADLPSDLFGLYVGNKAKIEKAKGKT